MATMTRRRAVGFFGMVGAALVALAVTAWACTNLATLNLSAPAGKPGEVITITGSSFTTVCICGPALPATPVKIRWNGVRGNVLAEQMPEKSGAISAAFTVPETQPGYYVIVATQHDETYHLDAAGTPARATFEVLGPNGESVVGNGELGAVATSPDQQSSSGLLAMTIGLGVLGLALLAGGSVAVIRQVSGRRVRTPAVARQD
jgi:hypothetical protein